MPDPNDRPYGDQGYDAPYEDTIVSSPTQPTATSRSAEAREPDTLFAPPLQAAPEPPDLLASQAILGQESTLILPPREEDIPGLPAPNASPVDFSNTSIAPKKSRKWTWI